MPGSTGEGGDRSASAVLEPERSPRRDDLALLRGRRPSPLSVFQALRGNLRHGKRLLLAVELGMLVAVVLLCAVPLYSSLVGNLDLRLALNANGPIGRNIELIAANPAYVPNGTGYDRSSIDHLVRTTAPGYLSSFASVSPTYTLTTADMTVARINTRAAIAPPDQVAVTPQAYDYAQAGPHMTLVTGRLPQPAASGAAAPLEALVTAQMARERSIHVGDSLIILEPDATPVALGVVGIWQPKDPNDTFWNSRSFVSVPQDVSVNAQLFRYPVLLDQTALAATFGAKLDTNVEQHWIYYTDSERITTDTIGKVAGQVQRFRETIEAQAAAQAGTTFFGNPVGAQFSFITRLPDVARAVGGQLGLLAQPLYVVVAQLEGLALLFVAAMAGLLVEAQSAEIATLRSRGASAAQMLGGYGLQGAALAVVAGVVGPWLAGLVALELARLALPGATSGAIGSGDSLASLVTAVSLSVLAQSRLVLVPAVAGAALGMGATVLAAWQALRLDVLAYRREQGRQTRQPFWRRLYLDVALAVVCVLAYLELSTFGGLGVREHLNQTGQASTSALIYAAPALLLLAGGLLALRVFPVAAGLGARVASRARGATGMLAFTQVARSAGGPMRVALLLALGVGMACFALIFSASLAQNSADRAAYTTGADVRVSAAQPLTGGDATRARAALAALPGVTGETPVYRGAAMGSSDINAPPAALLAVDPATWATVAGAVSWRGDYADTSPGALMAQLQVHQWPAAAAGAAPSALGDASHPLWAVVSDALAANLHLRVGQRFTLRVANVNADGTTFIAGALVHNFPTLYPGQVPGGFVVVALGDAEAVRASPAIGTNEWWLRTTGNAAFAAALARVAPNLSLTQTLDRRQIAAQIAASPLLAGMRGLLAVGITLTVVLALLGGMLQAALGARGRLVQFAVLRSLGMRARQLRRMLLAEQAVVYLFGLIGGTMFGVGLAVATLPYLEFGDAVLDPTTVGVPPERLVANPASLVALYAALLVGFVIGLLVTAAAANRMGLGQTLRLGED